ncbi:hypothetical protein EDB19DRAFT_1904732 [Suillus lakei]|nr:hypothetical protein EDB19DRAFT_1904732 [Suillus lakei]
MAINKPDIVKKAFEMRHVHTFNLSYKSLTSYAVQEKLRNLKVNDPQFWEELTSHAPQEMKDSTTSKNENESEIPGEAVEIYGADPSDDTNVPCASIIADMLGNAPSVEGVEKLNGRLISNTEAESMEFAVDVEDTDCEPDQVALGRGKRKKKANTLYSHRFWRHHDDGE